MNELRNRGVEDILIAVVDRLKGCPEAITAAFPQPDVQTPTPPIALPKRYPLAEASA